MMSAAARWRRQECLRSESTLQCLQIKTAAVNSNRRQRRPWHVGRPWIRDGIRYDLVPLGFEINNVFCPANTPARCRSKVVHVRLQIENVILSRVSVNKQGTALWINHGDGHADRLYVREAIERSVDRAVTRIGVPWCISCRAGL